MTWQRIRGQGLLWVVSIALVATACGADDAGEATTSAGTTPTAAPSTTVAPTTAPPATTTTTEPTTTTMPPTTTPPGDPIDMGPKAGDVIAVVGVAYDDVLNVREAPGIDQRILAMLDPLEAEVVAVGNARELPHSIWYEVEAGGVRGWISAAYVAYLGDVTDVTAAVIAGFGEAPAAVTMGDLGEKVAEALASDDPESRITMSVLPSVGDLGEVTYDVIGLGDDALFGLRLHVFGTPHDSGDGFVLKSVEQTALCGRGASDGLCV
jgi:hypothetical protein